MDVVLPAAQLPHAGRLAPARRPLNVGSSAAQRPPAAAMNPSLADRNRERGEATCYLDKGYFSLSPFFSFFETFFWSFIKLQLTVIRKRGRRCLRFGKAGVNVQS